MKHITFIISNLLSLKEIRFIEVQCPVYNVQELLRYNIWNSKKHQHYLLLFSSSYYSGNIAVSMSRKGDGSRGLYVIVFDNNESHNVLAYFMPNGCTACYHRNGSIHMLTDGKGGKLLDEVKWVYPFFPFSPISLVLSST